MGVIAPPSSAGILRRIGGILLLILAIVVAILIGWGIVQLIALPFGGIGTAVSFFWSFVLLVVVLGVLIVVGRRRQKRARARAAEQRASQFKR
jgi:membrane protein implicated in regulation of membrane protease activity